MVSSVPATRRFEAWLQTFEALVPFIPRQVRSVGHAEVAPVSKLVSLLPHAGGVKR